ncbi:unnamed protein product [Urochloa humidicola]
MVAADRPPPCAVLLRGVDVNRLSDDLPQPQAWGAIRCPTRKVYGCGERGQQLLEGLTLHLRIIDDHRSPKPHLFPVHPLQGRRAPCHPIGIRPWSHGDKPLVQAVGGGREMYARGLVYHADESLVAITLVFRLREDERVYHLVYETTTPPESRSPWPRIYRTTYPLSRGRPFSCAAATAAASISLSWRSCWRSSTSRSKGGGRPTMGFSACGICRRRLPPASIHGRLRNGASRVRVKGVRSTAPSRTTPSPSKAMHSGLISRKASCTVTCAPPPVI